MLCEPLVSLGVSVVVGTGVSVVVGTGVGVASGVEVGVGVDVGVGPWFVTLTEAAEELISPSSFS